MIQKVPERPILELRRKKEKERQRVVRERESNERSYTVAMVTCHVQQLVLLQTNDELFELTLSYPSEDQWWVESCLQTNQCNETA